MISLIDEVLNLHAEKLNINVIWNVISVFVIAICGLILNIVIGRYYGVQAIGYFNLIASYFIIGSLAISSGIHFSILHYIPLHTNDKKTCSKIIGSSIHFVSINFICWGIILYVSYRILSSFGIVNTNNTLVNWLILGLLFFSWNRAFAAALNGASYMREYAFLQAGRFVTLLLLCVSCVLAKINYITMPIILAINEIILCVIIILFSFKLKIFSFSDCDSFWLKKHCGFSYKSFLNGFILELNPKISIIILGFFSNHIMLGIYSIALMVVLGVEQLLLVLQTHLNPYLSVLYKNKQNYYINKLIQTGKIKYPLITLLLAITAIILYPKFIFILMKITDPKLSLHILIILFVGLLISAPYIPFNMLLNQSGHTKQYTIYLLAIMFTNIFSSLVLIPCLGIYGAALATTTSALVGVITLKFFLNKILKT